MSYLNILITPKLNPQKSYAFNKRLKDGFTFNILSKGTLASEKGINILNGNSLWNYNRKWFREINFPPEIRMLKDQFYLDVQWGMFLNTKNYVQNYSVAFQYNLLNLKTSSKPVSHAPKISFFER